MIASVVIIAAAITIFTNTVYARPICCVCVDCENPPIGSCALPGPGGDLQCNYKNPGATYCIGGTVPISEWCIR